MIPVTQQQRDNALDALNNMWPNVPPEKVFPMLTAWTSTPNELTCNTTACFGGWCAWWPNFQKQGVVAYRGVPNLESGGVSPDVSFKLFGCCDMFASRGAFESDTPGPTDHEVITNRLKWLIANSEVTK